MDEALGVDGSEGPQYRDHHIQGVVYRDLPAVVGDIGLEADTLDVVHDKVRGVIFVKVAGDRGNIGVADEFCQGPGLLLEPLSAVGEVLGPALHRHGDGGADAGGDLIGHELLDSHLGLQLGVPGQVGDAEAALAQHPAHDVAVIQHSPRPQGHRVLLLVLRQVEAAVGAGAGQTVPLLEAVVAEICCCEQNSLPPLFFGYIGYMFHRAPIRNLLVAIFPNRNSL